MKLFYIGYLILILILITAPHVTEEQILFHHYFIEGKSKVKEVSDLLQKQSYEDSGLPVSKCSIKRQICRESILQFTMAGDRNGG